MSYLASFTYALPSESILITPGEKQLCNNTASPPLTSRVNVISGNKRYDAVAERHLHLNYDYNKINRLINIHQGWHVKL